MVRRTTIVLAMIGCLLLSGCSFLPLPLPFGPIHDAAVPEAPEVGVGACLAGANGVDSDRRSVVECNEPHRYDVVGVLTWPGMAAATRDHDAADLFDDVLGDAELDASVEYFGWVFDACTTEVSRALGLDELGYDDAVRLLPGGTYVIDASLASRADFMEGDHTTVCSLAWMDDRDESTVISFAPGADITDYFGDGIPSDARRCFDEFGDYAGCDAAHYTQRIANFDLLGAFGEEFTGAELSEQQLDIVFDYCEELVWELSPSEEEYILTYPLYLPEDVPEAADPTAYYTWGCDIVAPDGAVLEGDIYSDGTITEQGGIAA